MVAKQQLIFYSQDSCMLLRQRFQSASPNLQHPLPHTYRSYFSETAYVLNPGHDVMIVLLNGAGAFNWLSLMNKVKFDPQQQFTMAEDQMPAQICLWVRNVSTSGRGLALAEKSSLSSLLNHPDITYRLCYMKHTDMTKAFLFFYPPPPPPPPASSSTQDETII